MASGRATNEPTNYFALGKQSAKGQDDATFHYLRHLDGTGLEVNEDIESVREGGDGQEIGLRYKTAISMDGNAVANARSEIAARLLAWTLGADAATLPQGRATVASGFANEHILTPAPNVPYLSAEQFWADQVERSLDMKITSLEIEFEQGRPLKMTAALLGGGSAYFPATQGAATRETNKPFFYPFASVSLGGAANTKVTKGKITVKRGIDDGIRTNSLSREDAVEQNFDVDADLTIKYETAADYDAAHAGGAAGSQIPINLASTTLSIYAESGAGTTFRNVGLHLNQLDVTAHRVNKLDPDGKTMYSDVAFMGLKGATHQFHAKVTTASVAALV